MSAVEYFSEGISSAIVMSVNCSGTETGILECGHESTSQGYHCDTAGVVCQGLSLSNNIC